MLQTSQNYYAYVINRAKEITWADVKKAATYLFKNILWPISKTAFYVYLFMNAVLCTIVGLHYYFLLEPKNAIWLKSLEYYHEGSIPQVMFITGFYVTFTLLWDLIYKLVEES